MTALAAPPAASTDVLQFSTFYVGDLLLGVDIRLVQEINKQLSITPVPNAPNHVRGVINLRGEVATVIDLRTVLGLPEAEQDRNTRNLIVHSQGEAIGLLVDRISDILTVRADQINDPPSNVDGVDGKFFLGVHALESEICVFLNVEQVLCDRNCSTR